MPRQQAFVSFFESIVLGIVQGFSEFLPISSSAHLILTSHYLGWTDQGLSFDMAANSGSLLAVLVFARRELLQVIGGAARAVSGWRRALRYRLGEARFAVLLTVATIPVALAGWMAREFIETVARSPLMIAATSILFAGLLWLADRRREGELYLSDITLRMAVIIGLAQALALMPGTSRAGVTLTAALLLGFKREAAVRFSFLLAVPVGVLVAGSQVAELSHQSVTVHELESMLVGFAAAAISAYVAITWFVAWVRRQSLAAFVVYRVALGLVILMTALW